ARCWGRRMRAMNFIRFLFSLGGRVNRAKWWLFVLGGLTLLFVTVLPLFRTFTDLLSGDSQYSAWSAESRIAIAITLFLLWWFPSFYVWVAVSVRRLHDRGRSGWWLLLFFRWHLCSVGSNVPQAIPLSPLVS